MDDDQKLMSRTSLIIRQVDQNKYSSVSVLYWVLSILQDWCLAAQVVTAGGSAGLLWCPVGQHAGQPLGATACHRLYSHTLWPHGVTAPANTHAGLRPQTRGECLCIIVKYTKLNLIMKTVMGLYCDMFQPYFFAPSMSFVICLIFFWALLVSVFRWNRFVFPCKIQMFWCRGTCLKSCSTFFPLLNCW